MQRIERIDGNTTRVTYPETGHELSERRYRAARRVSVRDEKGRLVVYALRDIGDGQSRIQDHGHGAYVPDEIMMEVMLRLFNDES